MGHAKTTSAPASLVNSTIAMVPVLCGLLAYDQMVRGNLSIGSLIVAVFCAQNIVLCFFWRRLESEYVKSFVLYLSVAFQWGYVATVTTAMWLGWKDGLWWANGIGLGVCAGGLALFSIKLGAERVGSSAIFSVLGVVATSTWGWSALNDSKENLFAAKSHNRLTSSKGSSESLLHNLIPMATERSAHGWAYAGDEGPSHWAALKQEYSTCASGREQSPVDLPRRATVSSTNVQFDYKSEGARVVNNGQTIQVHFSGESRINLDGATYRLKQAHFHTPSEHTVSGLMYPMEMHLVHVDASSRLAIVGVLVEKGSEHEVISKVLKSASDKPSNDSYDIGAIDVNALLPKDRSSWKYQGSLTTPPCTEGVTWAVFTSPMELSEKQIAAFRALYPLNARPVQPLFDRSFPIKVPALAH